jgi:hypothetical protein
MNEYREKLLSVGTLKHGLSKSSVVKEDKKDGTRRKHVTDEAGNTVTEWANKQDRVDVNIRPKIVGGKSQTT